MDACFLQPSYIYILDQCQFNSITLLFQQWESSPNVDRLYNKVYIKQSISIDLAQPQCQYL